MSKGKSYHPWNEQSYSSRLYHPWMSRVIIQDLSSIDEQSLIIQRMIWANLRFVVCLRHSWDLSQNPNHMYHPNFIIYGWASLSSRFIIHGWMSFVVCLGLSLGSQFSCQISFPEKPTNAKELKEKLWMPRTCSQLVIYHLAQATPQFESVPVTRAS
jgi:hypothetical protein